MKKLGGFYNVYEDDTYILFYLFHYQIKNHRAGFPLSAYHKVVNVLEENKINYEIDGKDEKKDFKKENRYEVILSRGKKLYERECRSKKIYEQLDKLKTSELDELLSLIEDYVFER